MKTSLKTFGWYLLASLGGLVFWFQFPIWWLTAKFDKDTGEDILLWMQLERALRLSQARGTEDIFLKKLDLMVFKCERLAKERHNGS
jgi:hypothetical protein